jgi:hypothetical protein
MRFDAMTITSIETADSKFYVEVDASGQDPQAGDKVSPHPSMFLFLDTELMISLSIACLAE